MTQHIGDVDTLQTFQFHKEATRHLLNLTGCSPGAVARDLHPLFTTSKYAEEIARELGVEVVPVQHHYAHVSGLMAEHNLDEIVGICCDGYGYGDDGSAWGGEIIFADQKEHRRVGHLEAQPMIGGDLATKHPLRMAAGILRDDPKAADWVLERADQLPHGRKEAEMILKQLRSGKTASTTSCGRVLDAVSAILGLCYERTYEGEPAMKLESAAVAGKDVLNIEPALNGDAIETSVMVGEIFANLGRMTIPDLAYSAQSHVARSLGESAIATARDLGVKSVGFTGGVACNELITRTLKATVEQARLRFLLHENVPPGDGGLSFGQAVVAAQTLQ